MSLRTGSAGAVHLPPHEYTPSAASVQSDGATPRAATNNSRTSCAALTGAAGAAGTARPLATTSTANVNDANFENMAMLLC